jgi:hypothetical protein
MNRRGFFGWVAGAMAHVGFLTKPASVHEFWYDWQPGKGMPWTNDPKFLQMDPPLGCPPNVVLLDGKRVESDYWIVRLQTGDNGWIEHQVRETFMGWESWERESPSRGVYVSYEPPTYHLTHPEKFEVVHKEVSRYTLEVWSNWDNRWYTDAELKAQGRKWVRAEPNIRDKDGNLIPEFGEERIKTLIVRGRVEYRCEGVN